MLYARHAFLVLVPALALAGCGADTTADENAVAVDQPIAIGFRGIAGTFTDENAPIGNPSLLVLKTDGTFHEAMILCTITSCEPVERDGNYELSRQGAARFINLVFGNDEALRYQYDFHGTALQLRRDVPSSTWRVMHRAAAGWCAAPVDCSLQNLPLGPCAGSWACASSECSYTCGRATPLVDQ